MYFGGLQGNYNCFISMSHLTKAVSSQNILYISFQIQKEGHTNVSER